MRNVIVFVDDGPVLEAVEATLAECHDIRVRVVDCQSDAVIGMDAFSVLVTDLPVDSGEAFLKALKVATSPFPLPIVILTNPHNEQLAVQAQRSVAAGIVTSQFVEDELKKTIDSVFDIASRDRDAHRVMSCLAKWDGKFVLENDRRMIPPLVRYLQDSTRRMGMQLDPSGEMQLGVALEEALLNGIYHGNLEVSSELREQDDASFYELVEQRCHQQPYRDRRVCLDVSLSHDQAVFVVRDDGPGFDVASVADPTKVENLEREFGRGMLLMRKFMDEVKYNDVGNEVRMVKRGKVA